MSVSLLAVAALAASLYFTTRHRQEKTPPAAIPAGESQPAEQSLDAIREAGL